jgi:hypothetical protein
MIIKLRIGWGRRAALSSPTLMMIIILGQKLRNKWGNYQIIEFALISFLTDSQCPTVTVTN